MTRKALIGFLVLLGGGLFLIPINSAPPAHTRIILEHTYKTYIAPPCFEQAQATNNLGEWNLAKARELNYKAESSCTEELLKPERKPVFKLVAEKIGLTSGQWNW
ncbi:hypothetical protein J31TS4_18250 [Paenibacillus sp. J31TS4]|uniref:hypothetical protein n=1 Tax=Paenibacillus sp. J31TS4 TaxID=2807195 RepID=UPI001B0F9E4F|nr:hypothetical protein [Paenibacillus sp. J31TS4]GIP38545.1 hypothetical protein J31TS4_18250 [Paenibacillus sp. J31TS4]